ncbi:antibiotic biosynthesis monooxygenase [Amphibacillus jilinensis]|uniref:antibiotic biosynthesis monooxygenase n=1 Tax=Amphibacillus jilinensis TaxID=1216008 RepID=UPI0002DD38ED|nr:antibiotic biosynthesis monooxygenase [Amphibacillus jilinensis]
MLVQLRKFEVEKGYSDQVVENFSEESPVDQFAGLIDRSVMVNKRLKDHEEVVMMIRWQSKKDWKNWEKSDVHLQGHRNNKGKERPSYILNVEVKMYEVESYHKGKN